MEQIMKDYFYGCLNAIDSVIIYKEIKENPVIKKLTAYLSTALACGSVENAAGLRSDFLAMLINEAERSAFHGNIFKKFIIKLFLKDENNFSLCLEKATPPTDASLNAIVLNDMRAFKFLMDVELPMLLQDDGISQTIGAYVPAAVTGRHNSVLSEYIEKIEHTDAPDVLVKLLGAYYRAFGCGNIGIYTMFRYSAKRTVTPIKNSDGIALSDIIGYDAQKAALISNTEAFLAGYPCNNALLAGARGTGKSSIVKALANRYFEKGLRLLELSKDQLVNLPEILNILKKRGKHFIIFMDDLSFDENEVEYKHLKSMLEGGAETRPRNVLFYATSNRRHIIQEKWADKNGVVIEDGEIHASDTLNEKLSLADRFGITVVFQKPSPAEYLNIVKGIAEKEGLALSEEFLTSEAVKWELNQKGLSGRAARQYINSLAWQLKSADYSPKSEE